MTEPARPKNKHKAYHAHVYFDAASLAFASQLCEEAGAIHGLKVGRIHQRPIGPHTRWSCQIIFTQDDFDVFVPWLDQHRQGLTVFVHGLTGNDLKDHTEYAYWLGDQVELDLSIFQKKST